MNSNNDDDKDNCNDDRVVSGLIIPSGGVIDENEGIMFF
jgi:hypothetical protein